MFVYFSKKSKSAGNANLRQNYLITFVGQSTDGWISAKSEYFFDELYRSIEIKVHSQKKFACALVVT